MDSELIIKEIINDLETQFQSDKVLRSAWSTMRSGTGSYKDVYKASEVVAEIVRKGILAHVPPEMILDPELVGAIGDKVITPILGRSHSELIDMASLVEAKKLEKLRVGLKPIKTEANVLRVSDLGQKFNKAITEKDFINLMAGETIKQFYDASVDEFIKANADFQYEAGLTTVLIRASGSESCPFCESLTGVYEYPISEDINPFARHTGCTCTIDVRTSRGGSFTRVKNYRLRR